MSTIATVKILNEVIEECRKGNDIEEAKVLSDIKDAVINASRTSCEMRIHDVLMCLASDVVGLKNVNKKRGEK